MAVTTTSYIDPNGNKRTGYIFDGHTYEDEAGTTPVALGSVVDTAAGRYIKTAGGGQLYTDYLKNNGITEVQTEKNGVQGTGYVQNGATYTDPLLQKRVDTGTVVTGLDGTKYIKTDTGSQLYADYLKQPKQPEGIDTLKKQRDELDAAYNRALAANDTVYAAQLQQQRAGIQAQIDALNRQYQGLNRQLYRDYMMNQRDLPQTLAAQGITGGMAESSRIGLATGYESDLAANERERITGITDLERGGTDAQLTLAIEKARQDAQAEDNRYTRLAALLAAEQQQKNYERELAAEEENTAYNRALAEAQIAAQNGDSRKLYALLGIQPQPTPEYTPVYNPVPETPEAETPVPETPRERYTPEGQTRSDALELFARAAARTLETRGAAAADDYLAGRVSAGFITQAEKDEIEERAWALLGL